ncbi:hypothetical protein [Cellulomonas sp. S1-8]|uniref:hypothetical protein n=1 Tax=Cellulomonas sp. S1-8 TaxID=2904790 RepID=UPI0022439F26|nr:hypothetical protein [Cellulomonas sp. S1-8]UZN04058.1 hypothetical protein OKX07_03725 [Cellulomonas sp. S1-8]
MRATSTVRAMAPVARRASPPPRAHLRAHLLGALGAALALASVVLGVQGRVLLHHCVTADGPLAALGVRMAVLRSAAECPDGAFGLGATAHGAVLLLSVAVPVLAVHVLLTACGLGLGVVTRRAVTTVVALLATHLVPTTTPGVVVPAVPGGASPVRADVAVRRDRGHDPARPHRGPPAR